jgi:acyl dehydratase
MWPAQAGQLRREGVAMSIPRYHVLAFNTSKESENKIHDDATARRFGFKGGFVGGVNVYAYMSHQPAQHWGRAWLERGTASARFSKPVYEGDVAEVSATLGADGMTLEVHSLGELCATGHAAMPADPPPAPALSDYKAVAPRAERAEADEMSLRVGDWLGMRPTIITEALHAQDLANTRETDPIYIKERILHSVTVLRCCNLVLSHNVLLPAWIHMGSTVRNLGIAKVGDTLNVRARITRNYEHKGHMWVVLDALVVANEATSVMQATHTAIYRPRQVAEAA